MDTCPKCNSERVGGVEYAPGHPERFDGVSEWYCISCGYRQGRWTGKELLRGFVEPRNGRGGEPVQVRVTQLA